MEFYRFQSSRTLNSACWSRFLFFLSTQQNMLDTVINLLCKSEIQQIGFKVNKPIKQKKNMLKIVSWLGTRSAYLSRASIGANRSQQLAWPCVCGMQLRAFSTFDFYKPYSILGARKAECIFFSLMAGDAIIILIYNIYNVVVLVSLLLFLITIKTLCVVEEDI